MSCHDGTVAQNIDIARSHPVGVSLVAAHVRRPHAFFSPWVVDPRIKLYNGRVECNTCHWTPLPPPGQLHPMGPRSMLVMSNRRSALCMSCHKRGKGPHH